ncbi:MAG: homoserine dehydrogenase, partial [Alphaproteobacteria bacterium]|nr:homoserine dehydrogenase [Alphaproteobacteria bacterium]
MRIAIAGLGNIGSAVLRLLRGHADLLKARGQEMIVTAVSARDRNRKRDCDVTGIAWVDDPLALAARRDVDVVVELIGGAEGVAQELALAAIANRKHLVTANKALIAAHGVSLARRAELSGLQMSFDAAVCGGLPVLKTLREGLAANCLSSVRGILNGTCNYILTRMLDEGMSFAAALAEAQGLGYAEADPSSDIDGIDTAQKLVLISALAFGAPPDLAAVSVEGIRAIKLADLQDAAARGGRIKLLGTAHVTESGIVQRVQPVFVPLDEPLARVGGAANGVEITGDFVGNVYLQGQGAGGDATASAVVSDLLDIAREHRSFAFGVAAKKLYHHSSRGLSHQRQESSKESKVCPSAITQKGHDMEYYIGLDISQKQT